MNNTVYIQLFDAVVNTYLIQHCGLRPTAGEQYGMVGELGSTRGPMPQAQTGFDVDVDLLSVHSHIDYFESLSFPAVAELAMRVNKLGKSSVTYEIAVFEKAVDKVRAVGEFIQVLVDRSTSRPNANGMNKAMRQGLERISVGADRSRL